MDEETKKLFRTSLKANQIRKPCDAVPLNYNEQTCAEILTDAMMSPKGDNGKRVFDPH